MKKGIQEKKWCPLWGWASQGRVTIRRFYTAGINMTSVASQLPSFRAAKTLQDYFNIAQRMQIAARVLEVKELFLSHLWIYEGSCWVSGIKGIG